MNINLDDPNLTAFALGELSGPEREAIAQAVAASPEAQAQVEEIQAMAGLLRRDFRLDLQHAAAERPSIVALLEQGNLWRDWRWVSLTAAAALAIGAVIAAVALSPERSLDPVAQKQRRTRPDTIVAIQSDPTPAELLASKARLARLPSGSAAPADQRSGENDFASTAAHPISTFPVQVETASYSTVRGSIMSGSRPPKEAVRIEEMINYFSYDYPQPRGDQPFSIHADAATCPWQPANQLVRIGLKGREVPDENRGASNLVFLLDVSGSMHSDDRLPLLRSAMRLLVDRLTENDRVAIVVYAGASGVALPSTAGHRKEEIVRAIEELKADALSGGIEGIELAYQIAAANFIQGGMNRVILATDGELNVGVANERELVQLAKKRAQAGVSLTLLGLGDDAAGKAAMQTIAEQVTGNYASLDSVETARNALIAQVNGTLVTIAKDVEVEVVFDPARVSSYRLIGFDNQLRRREDSSSATADGSEIRDGHTATALYEVVPADLQSDAGQDGSAWMTVKLHHTQPESGVRMVTEHSVNGAVVAWEQAPPDFRFTAAVAEFGMILRDSPHKGNGSLAAVLVTAEGAKGADREGFRAGFVDLVRRAQALAF